jgi:hypothetical protein
VDLIELTDERGAYLLVTCEDGKEFLIDAEDKAVLGDYVWKVYAPYENTQYVYRLGGPRDETILLHRLIMGSPVGLTVDHRDWNGLNCRRYNLRACTLAQNIMSRSNKARSSSGGRRGVYKSGKRFEALFRHAGKLYSLGRFDTADEAAIRWDQEAIAKRGEFAVLNFPRDTL